MNSRQPSGTHRRRSMRRSVVAASVASLAISLAGPALAEPGQVDTAFGNGGRRVYEYGDESVGLTSRAVDSVRLSRGRIMVAFIENRAGVDHGILRLYRSDGSPVTGFGGAGEVDLGPNTQIGALTRAGRRAIVAGSVQDPIEGDRWVRVWKVGSSGVLDSTFSTDGIADPTDDRTTDHRAVDVALDSEGRIVVLADNTGLVGARVYRMTPTGAPDLTFSADGIASSLMFGDANNFPRAVTIDASDRVVIVASSLLRYDVGSGDMEIGAAVGRLTEAGEWDTTFSGDGQMAFGQGLETNFEPRDIELDSRARIVVVGTLGVLPEDPRPQVAVMRLRPRGALDTTFSGDGLRTIGFDASGAEGLGLDVLSADRLLVSGNASGLLGMAILRADARFDRSFSGDGSRTVKFGPSTSNMVATVLNPTASRVVLTGTYPGLAGGFGMVAVSLT